MMSFDKEKHQELIRKRKPEATVDRLRHRADQIYLDARKIESEANARHITAVEAVSALGSCIADLSLLISNILDSEDS